MTWPDLSSWWLSELSADPAYEVVVTPLLMEVLAPVTDALYLDLGCGEGRVMRQVTASAGARVHGVDVSFELAVSAGVVAVAELPGIPMRGDAYDGVYSVLTLEHLDDHKAFFAEAARVTVEGGILALVVNHPIWTAPESTPITDDDGEVLWRSGRYFDRGSSEVPAGNHAVVFHHRSMASLFNAAARAGWSLEHMIELPHHELDEQAGIPRLLACRWRLLP
jgi:SAM-dependent methyltransferase